MIGDRMLEFEAFLETSDPGRLVRVWGKGLHDLNVEIIEGKVDGTSVTPLVLTRQTMNRVQRLVQAHGLRLREPRRMFLRRWR